MTTINSMTMAELKSLYRRACKAFHPDNGGDAEMFKELQKEYRSLKASIERREKARKEAEEKARKEAEEKARKEAKRSKKAATRVSNADMNPKLFQLLSSFESVLDVHAHGKDGYVFTLQGQPRKRVFEIYRVKNGYTIWIRKGLAEVIDLTKASRIVNVHDGEWGEYKFTSAEDVITTLLKLW